MAETVAKTKPNRVLPGAFSSKAEPIFKVWQVFWLVRCNPAFPYVYGDI